MARIGKVVEFGGDLRKKRSLVTLIFDPRQGYPNADFLWTGLGSASGATPASFIGRFQRFVDWFKSIFWSENVEFGGTAKFKGLREAIEVNHFTAPEIDESDGSDIVHVARPFKHFVVSMPEGQQYSDDNRNLEKYFRNAFGLWESAPRFLYSQTTNYGTTEHHHAVVHFGFGVFVPKDNEMPVGSLQLANMHDSEWTEPLLPNGGNKPAAFYKGQEGLSFAADSALAPAFCKGVGLPRDYIFYFGRLTDSGEPMLTAMHADEALGQPRPRRAKHFFLCKESENGNIAEWDFSSGIPEGETVVVCSEPDKPIFKLRWFSDVQDNRRFVLRDLQPKGGCLRLEGIILPPVGRVKPLAECWVDFSQSGRLQMLAVQGRRYSIACTGKTGAPVYLYDWKELAAVEKDYGPHSGEVAYRPGESIVFGDGGSGYMGSSVTGGEQMELLVDYLKDGEGNEWGTLLKTGTWSFGYMILPLPGSNSYAIRLRKGSDAFSIPMDWLDRCGEARKQGWKHHIDASSSIGVASWSMPNAGITLRVESDRTLSVKDNSVRSIGRKSLGTLRENLPGQVFPATSSGLEVQNNEEFVLGCYLFRYIAS